MTTFWHRECSHLPYNLWRFLLSNLSLASRGIAWFRGSVFHKLNEEGYFLDQKTCTLVIFEVLSSFEVKSIFSEHSEHFDMVISSSDMSGAIESYLKNKLHYFSLQLMLMLSFLSFFYATSTLPFAHRLINSSSLNWAVIIGFIYVYLLQLTSASMHNQSKRLALVLYSCSNPRTTARSSP